MAFGRYEFRIVLAGYGDSPEKAWDDATESFAQDPGPCPCPDEYTFEEEGGEA